MVTLSLFVLWLYISFVAVFASKNVCCAFNAAGDLFLYSQIWRLRFLNVSKGLFTFAIYRSKKPLSEERKKKRKKKELLKL